MRQTHQGAALMFRVFMLAFVAVCAACGSGSAQTASNQLLVSLVRQDFSDCSNGNVSDKDPSPVGGYVVVNRGSDGITRVKVAMTVKPNTTYHFFLKCVRLLGDIRTEDEGEGNAAFEFPTNSVGNVYAFDMYPEGAPAGNKYQSVQVKFP